jgi:hypothetical protein
VTRGTIEPFYWVRKTAGQMKQELKKPIIDILREEYIEAAREFKASH